MRTRPSLTASTVPPRRTAVLQVSRSRQLKTLPREIDTFLSAAPGLTCGAGRGTSGLDRRSRAAC